ncbi:MAG: sigma-E processing peptidase SpoIIGA [Beduini sp.]|uniref:sigma-E processing peptidase SpoIIGA n=1 Tax=Beduini sp. TaxID=1922300 RepID=UPI0011CC3B9D
MEVYIESIILQQILLHGICFLSALIFVNKLLIKKEIIVYLILISLISFNLYIKLPSLMMYFIIFLIHLLFYKKESFLFYCSYMISYHFFVFVLLKINTYSTFQHGIFIIYRFENLLINIVFLFIIIVCYLAHAFFLKRNLALKQLYYPVQFTYRGKDYQLKGYLDTGNKATYQGIPIIFIKEGLLKEDSYETIEIQTVNGYSDIKIVYLRNIQIGKERYVESYLGIVNEMSIDGDCLLNVALLYKG